jgi:ADP-heptose:LPS heptosyltransferase
MSALQGPDGAPMRIGVLRALQLGDLLCAVPALRALRHAHPEAWIVLIGLPWANAFAQRFNRLIDAFVAFPGYPGLPERPADPAAYPRFVAQARAMRFDAVLQLHGSGEISNAIAFDLGARSTAGFHSPTAASPDPARFRPWPTSGSEVERCLALTDFLGMPRRGDALEFPLSDGEHADAQALCDAHGLRAGAFVCVHPGARLASRRWPVERFAALARYLDSAGQRVVVTGTRDEQALCARLAAEAGAIDFCDRTPLGVLAALVSRARLVVCNDTGISHIAAALRTPSVVVSCGADPARFAPADRARHRVLACMTACRPCMHANCPTAHECATGLELSAVMRAVSCLLDGRADASSRALAA